MKDPRIKLWLPVVVLAFGLLIFSFRALVSGASFLQTAFIKVEKPPTYRFTTYNDLLGKYVNGDLVNYKELAHSPELAKAMDDLARTSPERMVDDRERLAYWINAYNLLVLKAICDRYPIDSVKRLGNTFNSRLFTVGGKQYTIQDIYVSNLTPLMKKVDVETLYLICGGAMGYPALVGHAIVAGDMYRDTRFAAFKFLNDSRNAFYDDTTHRFSISPLLQWNHDLFLPLADTIHDYVNERLEEKRQYDPEDNILIKDYGKRFDWRLNDSAFQTKSTDDAK